jgi:hypothetical protein
VRVERIEGMVPASWFVDKDKYVIFDKPPISEGREPVMDFEGNESEITSPDIEQVRPDHTGEEHLLATLVQFQAGSLDWMFVLLMSAHKLVSSSVRTATAEERLRRGRIHQSKGGIKLKRREESIGTVGGVKQTGIAVWHCDAI